MAKHAFLLVVLAIGLSANEATADCPHPDCWSVCHSGDLCSKPCCDNGDNITCGQYHYAPPCCQPNWVITQSQLLAGYCSRSFMLDRWIFQNHYLYTYVDTNHCQTPDTFQSCLPEGTNCVAYLSQAACCADAGPCWGAPGCGDYDGAGCVAPDQPLMSVVPRAPEGAFTTDLLTAGNPACLAAPFANRGARPSTDR